MIKYMNLFLGGYRNAKWLLRIEKKNIFYFRYNYSINRIDPLFCNNEVSSLKYIRNGKLADIEEIIR